LRRLATFESSANYANTEAYDPRPASTRGGMIKGNPSFIAKRIPVPVLEAAVVHFKTHPDWTGVQIAKATGLATGFVNQFRLVAKETPQHLAAILRGDITVSKAIKLRRRSFTETVTFQPKRRDSITEQDLRFLLNDIKQSIQTLINREVINGRHRIRFDEMAAELSISTRLFRQMVTKGIPCTRFKGIIWFEPEKVHEWLDQFNTEGSPGIKRKRGFQIDRKFSVPNRNGHL
jgi:hypothetical protein